MTPPALRAARARPTLLALVLLAVAAAGWYSPSHASTPSTAPAATTTATTATTASSTTTRPNIVFVLTDDLSNDLVRYMPHVVGLERTGATFTNYSVTDSLCCPSRSSIFTGEFPHDTGVFTNQGDDGGWGTFHSRGNESHTFATSLHDAGYRTAMMGKYLNQYQPDGTVDGQANYVPPGWDEWDVAGNGYPEYDYKLNHNGTVETHGHAPEDYLTNVISQRGSDFIRSSVAAKKPFMLELATFAPHSPSTPAPRDERTFPGLRAPRGPAYNTLPTHAPRWLASRKPLTATNKRIIDERYRKRVQSIQAVDRMVGNLQSTLIRAGVSRNTLIVFSSDNGFHMGQYRLLPGKQTAFDTDIHVPLIMSGPGVRPRARVSQPTQNIDLAPTFETLGGVKPAASVDGHTLTPLMHGGYAAWWRGASLVEHHGPNLNRSDPDYQASFSGNPPSYRALRTDRYTYVRYVDGSHEFYDRQRDPNELHNTYGRLTTRQKVSLSRALYAMATCHGSSECWRAGHRAG